MRYDIYVRLRDAMDEYIVFDPKNIKYVDDFLEDAE